MKTSKYTKELLEPLVKESISYAQVLRKLGKKQSGGIANYVRRIIKTLEIDTSHFQGRHANPGGIFRKKKWEDVLVFREGSTRRQDAYKLRRALIESGRYECAKCQNEGCW